MKKENSTFFVSINKPNKKGFKTRGPGRKQKTKNGFI